MPGKKYLLTAIQLGLVLTLISACTSTSTPTTTSTATTTISEVVIESTQVMGVGFPFEPAQEPNPNLMQGEVITPENAHQITQLDYRGRGSISGIAWSPDGAQLAIASSSGIYLVDAATYEENHFSYTSSSNIAFSPNGVTLASAEGSSVSLWDIATGKVLRSLKGHADMVYSIAFSPDGKWLASGSQDGTMKLWDTLTGKELTTQQGGGTFLYQVAFSPLGKLLATVAYEQKIILWDVSNVPEMHPVTTFQGTLMAFSPVEGILATGSYNEPIKLWDISTQQEVRSLTEQIEAIGALAFSPDGKMLASGSEDTTIRLWDTSTNTELNTLKGHDEMVSNLVFSPDGKRLASASQKTIKVWDVASGQELRSLTGQTNSPSVEGIGNIDGYGGYAPTIAFSPDGDTLAVGIESGPVKLYDSSTGELLGELAPPANRIVRVTFSPDSKLLAVAYDQFVPTEVIGVQIWDVATQTSLLVIDDFLLSDGFTGAVFGLAFSPDGSLLATSGGNPWGAPGFVRVWDVADGKLVLDMGFTDLWMDSSSCNDHCYGTTYNIGFNPDGSILAGVNDDGRVHLFDMEKQEEISVFQGVGGYGNGIAFSPDGKLLATSGSANNSDGTADLRLLDVSTGRQLYKLEGHTQSVISVAFSPNGQVLASSSWDGSVRLWDVESGNILAVLDSPMVADIAFSPDGTLLATSGDVVRLWGVPAPEVPTLAYTLGYGSATDTEWSPDGRTLAVGTSAGIALYNAQNLQDQPAWHTSIVVPVNHLAFSPDSRLLAIAGWEGLAIWNLVSGQEQVLQTEPDAFSVAFSPDGSLLVTDSYTNDVQVWNVASGKPVIQLIGGKKGVLEVVAFSPDGKVVGAASSNKTEGHSDGVVRLWDMSTGKLLVKLGDSSSSLTGFAFSPDGKSLATGGPNKVVSIWEVASGKLLKRLEGHTGAVVSVAYSPDGLRLASVDTSENNPVHVWDVSSGQSLATMNGCRRTDYSNPANVHFSPDGSKLASACEEAGGMVWDVITGNVQHLSQDYSFGVSAIAYSPDGSILASGYSRNWDLEQPIDIVLWNMETKTEYSRLTGHLGIVNAVAFNPKAAQLASGGSDGTVRLWDLKTGASQTILEGYPLEEGSLTMYGTTLKMYTVSSLAYSPDGATLTVGGGGFYQPGWLELYDATTGKRLSMLNPTTCTFPCDDAPDVHQITFSPDGTLLATEDAQGVWLWDVARKQKLRQLIDEHYLTSVAFSPDGKILATAEFWSASTEGTGMTEADMRGGVHFWNVATGERLDLLDVGVEDVRATAFSPDGKFLAVGHARSVTLWDMTTGKALPRIECSDYPVFAFSPDGTTLAIGDMSGTISLWRLPNR